MLEAGQEKTEVSPTLPLLHVELGDHVFDVEVDGSPTVSRRFDRPDPRPEPDPGGASEGVGLLRLQERLGIEGVRGSAPED